MYQKTVTKAYCLTKNLLLIKLTQECTSDKITRMAYKSRISSNDDLYGPSIDRGWKISNKLIDTPYEPLRPWRVINLLLSNAITSANLLDDSTLEYSLNGKKAQVDISNYDIDLHIYAFYCREGFTVVEIPGKGYRVIDPYGIQQFTDLRTCNCINFLENKKSCLHLYLAKLHHQNSITNLLEESND